MKILATKDRKEDRGVGRWKRSLLEITPVRRGGGQDKSHRQAVSLLLLPPARSPLIFGQARARHLNYYCGLNFCCLFGPLLRPLYVSAGVPILGRSKGVKEEEEAASRICRLEIKVSVKSGLGFFFSPLNQKATGELKQT